MNSFKPNAALEEGILRDNPIPLNIMKEKMLDTHLRELPTEQDKRIALNQDRLVANIQQRISFTMGPLCRLWSMMEVEKNALLASTETDDIQSTNIGPMSELFDQTVLLFGQAYNSCSYLRRFNVLMSFMPDKKRVRQS